MQKVWSSLLDTKRKDEAHMRLTHLRWPPPPQNSQMSLQSILLLTRFPLAAEAQKRQQTQRNN